MMNPLTEHLREVGETYTEHLVKAAGFGIAMLAGGLACLVHALFPFLFVTTGSSSIRRLHSQMENRRASTLDRQDRRDRRDRQKAPASLSLSQRAEQLGSQSG